MKYQYYIADVFANRVFNGAQVAVFPEAEGLSTEQMTLVARELHLSESVFVFKQKNSMQMRIFTPRGEVNSAGHPVLATAFVLGSTGAIEKKEPYTSLTFDQNSVSIDTHVSWKNDKPSFIQFTRTVHPTVDYYTPIESELASFLGIDAGHIDTKKYSTRLVSCGHPYLVVPLFYYETLRDVKFDFSAWSRSIAPQTAAQEILLFSPKTPFQDSDFSVRLVGPNIGIHEDPPIGSVIPTFASYLCSFDHLQKGTYTFAVDRGDEKIRRSVINLEMDHKGEDTLNLRIGGEAVMVAEGMMEIPDL